MMLCWQRHIKTVTIPVPAGSQLLLAVADTSSRPADPGWLLRNVLLMAAYRWRKERMQVGRGGGYLSVYVRLAPMECMA